MLKKLTIVSFALMIILIAFSFKKNDDWGFYAHKMINQHAIYLLPADLIPTFKVHLEEIRIFAIAPDQRRHSSPHEAARHYTDLDHWGSLPFDNVPKNYDDAVWKMADIWLISKDGKDTLDLKLRTQNTNLKDSILTFFHEEIRYHEKSQTNFDLSAVKEVVDLSPFKLSSNYSTLSFHNNLDDYGILPYHLLEYQNKLKWAFVNKDIYRIIRLAGEIGHYIGDAHVPLHTTVNYNGQLTGQDGIHAFWETRIPELFAASEYDFWVEPREYIEDKEAFFWGIVLESHRQVGDVLEIEARLHKEFPQDQQFCFDERLGITQRIECREFARAYQNEMNGMVEKRMRDAITAIASSWYTAWIDAGSPVLTNDKIAFEIDTIATTIQTDTTFTTREHN